MNESPVNRVRRRRKKLGDEIAKLQEELDRLNAYLLVHEEFSRPPPRTVSGREIDALCQMALRDTGTPMMPAQLVDAIKDRFGAVIDAASPARLVSTRMSTLSSVESTEEGWRLVPDRIEHESETYQ